MNLQDMRIKTEYIIEFLFNFQGVQIILVRCIYADGQGYAELFVNIDSYTFACGMDFADRHCIGQGDMNGTQCFSGAVAVQHKVIHAADIRVGSNFFF